MVTYVQPILTIPVYRMPSLLLQGDDATNCGMVKGNFLRASLSELPSTYNEPSLGSGKNRGLETEQCRHCEHIHLDSEENHKNPQLHSWFQLGFEAGIS